MGIVESTGVTGSDQEEIVKAFILLQLKSGCDPDALAIALIEQGQRILGYERNQTN